MCKTCDAVSQLSVVLAAAEALRYTNLDLIEQGLLSNLNTKQVNDNVEVLAVVRSMKAAMPAINRWFQKAKDNEENARHAPKN